MVLLSSQKKDDVLRRVSDLLEANRHKIKDANAIDLTNWEGADQAMYDRLIVSDKKIDGMIKAVQDIVSDEDPVRRDIYKYTHPNGMKIVNRTAPFGTVLIIYESRPDVTIEAASVAFKSNNKIRLKGGKEAVHTNRALVAIWHQALGAEGLDHSWAELLELSRAETQEYLKNGNEHIDLIVPRGGESLIRFVKTHASCPVLISGRGNNFLYAASDADWVSTLEIITNGKTDKISACNALDKVLLDGRMPDLAKKCRELVDLMIDHKVTVLADDQVGMRAQSESEHIQIADLTTEWPKEYLDMKIAIGLVEDMDAAIALINRYSGGHSVTIMTGDDHKAQQFMEEIDAAAVYHNASTRFTDGGQFGLGAELAISTDKLHHRGPLGLDQLVTNKWYVFGNGQIRN